MAEYTQDYIFRTLAVYYGETAETAQFGDLWSKWLADRSLSDGFDLGEFYETQTGIKNFGDAEFAYWTKFLDFLLTEGNEGLLVEDYHSFLAEESLTPWP